jgi:hypothetical protein
MNPTPTAAGTFRPVQLKVSCMNIRHKLMYCDDRHATPGLVDDTSSTRVFFCVKTGDVLGPDDQPVHPTECKAGRACYCHGAPQLPSEADAAPPMA